jgi:hypothetical protein
MPTWALLLAACADGSSRWWFSATGSACRSERFGPWLGSRRRRWIFSNLALGFSTASTLYNIGFCLIGVLLGTLIGVLPGIGATATIAMLLPITFQIGDPSRR